MEKTLKEQPKHLDENLTICKRSEIKLDGILEINYSNESSISAKLHDTNIIILGNNLHVQKIDTENGILIANGNIETIKYGKTQNFFKRMFK